MLTSGTTDLDVELGSNTLELGPVFHEKGKVDVDRSTECGSEVGGAGGDVAQVVVMGETGMGFDNGSGSCETIEDGSDVSTLLHGDDTELILLIDPDEECLGIVVEDTTASGPVTVETASSEETISFPELKK